MYESSHLKNCNLCAIITLWVNMSTQLPQKNAHVLPTHARIIITSVALKSAYARTPIFNPSSTQASRVMSDVT